MSIAQEAGCYDRQHLANDYSTLTAPGSTAFFQVEKQAPEPISGIHENR
jgi:hypothetical protein